MFSEQTCKRQLVKERAPAFVPALAPALAPCPAPTPFLPLPLLPASADLMKECPELMAKALLIHNNLIRKALWMNFGYVIEQEGGEQEGGNPMSRASGRAFSIHASGRIALWLLGQKEGSLSCLPLPLPLYAALLHCKALVTAMSEHVLCGVLPARPPGSKRTAQDTSDFDCHRRFYCWNTLLTVALPLPPPLPLPQTPSLRCSQRHLTPSSAACR